MNGVLKNNYNKTSKPYFEVLDPNLNVADWMESYWDIIKDKTIFDVVLPGTHDSGSYSCSFEYGLAPFAPSIIKRKCLPRYAKDIAMNWTKTTTLDIIGQLSEGARYLDLRVCCSVKDNEIRTEHSIYGTKYEDLLYQVFEFILLHTKEFVILDFRHFGKIKYNDMSKDDHDRLVSLIQNIIGKYLVQKKELNEPLQKLFEKNHRIFAIYHDDDVANKYDFLQPNDSIWNHWTNTQQPLDLIEVLQKFTNEFEQTEHGQPIFFCLQSCMTPNKTMITNAIKKTYFSKCCKKVKNCPTSLLEVGVEANTALIKWIEGQTESVTPFNIICFDYIELFRSLVILIIHQNK